jgi:hypothetical protein
MSLTFSDEVSWMPYLTFLSSTIKSQMYCTPSDLSSTMSLFLAVSTESRVGPLSNFGSPSNLSASG